MNKVEFLQALFAKRAEFDEALSQIPHERMTVPGVNSDNWTIKDIVAHVAWYEDEATHILKSHTLASENPGNDEIWGLPVDERNAAIYERNRNLPLDEVLGNEQKAYEAFLHEAQTLDDEDLNDASRYADMPADWIPVEIVASNTNEHYEEHIDELRVWASKADKS